MTDSTQSLDGAFTGESAAKTYRFRFEPLGWAHFTINDATGEFVVNSDWGNYSYYCLPAMRTRDSNNPNRMHEFLAYCEPAFIARNMARYQHRSFSRQFDSEGTEREFREAIIEKRKEAVREEIADFSKEDARYCWREIDDLWSLYVSEWSDADSQETMVWEHFPRDLADKYGIGDDLHEWLVYKSSKRYVFLVERLLPFFLDWLRSSEKG